LGGEDVATKLTKAAIERIKAHPSGRQTITWDAELKGFGVLVSGKSTESGNPTAKSYIVQRRLPDGKTRRLTVGGLGEFERVEDARRKAGQLLAGLREGRDPKAERRKAAARDRTLRQWLDVYLAARKDLRERSVAEYRGAVARHLDAWLDRPMRELTPDMIEDRHSEIGKTAGPAAANGAMRALRAVWNLALDRDGALPANPVRRLKRAWFETPPRTRSVPAGDLATFFVAVEALPNRTAADYIKSIVFTGLRRREAAALRWSEIDFAERVIRLPAARLKGKRKLDLPMSDYVRDLLVARRAIGDDGGWVFGADSKSGHIEEPKFAFSEIAEATARARAETAGEKVGKDGPSPEQIVEFGITVSPHDLRRTFITVAEATDISPLALKALVSHSIGSDVTSGYVQLTVERLREPAQLVCDRLKKLCGIVVPGGDNVERVASR
jgi:integrase